MELSWRSFFYNQVLHFINFPYMPSPLLLKTFSAIGFYLYSFEVCVDINTSNWVPGGSSSESAVVVGAKLVDFTLGTDTGGSVRVPASYCGILGFRPSQDAISTAGVIPMAQSFDTLGKEPTI
uniref:Amidase domain-containing protein n=1 Tax=Fagus sylvatica TaxID=28930 RepID=A0A2N9EE58_FAGSY